VGGGRRGAAPERQTAPHASPIRAHSRPFPLTLYTASKHNNNKQGHEIAAYYWPVPRPRATVLLVHGQGSYLPFDFCRFAGPGAPKQYEGSWVAALNAAGYSVAGASLFWADGGLVCCGEMLLLQSVTRAPSLIPFALHTPNPHQIPAPPPPPI
jgi:hypothetical protein